MYRLVNYHDREVVIFKLSADRDPIPYDGKYYERIGANIQEIKFSEYGDLFRRFTQP